MEFQDLLEKIESAVQYLISAAQIISTPAPRQARWTQAITGTRHSSMALKRACVWEIPSNCDRATLAKSGRSLGSVLLFALSSPRIGATKDSAKSIPEVNIFPLPEKRTTRHSGSEPAASKTSFVSCSGDTRYCL